MKKSNLLKATLMIVAALGVAQLAIGGENARKPADDHRSKPAAGRQRGTPAGHDRIITHSDSTNTRVEVRHPVVTDHRPITVIHNDRTIVRVRVNVYPEGHVSGRWDHWHRDWGVYWRFADWSRIHQVTCEAVNTGNNYLYPVTGYNTDYPSAWNNEVANQLVEVAMDNCYNESTQLGANPDDCTLIDWECRYMF